MRSGFSTPHVQHAWTSTSLGAFKACPRLYYYTIIEGFRSRYMSVDIVFGDIYHKALELYDRRRAEGANHYDAMSDATIFTLIQSRGWESDHPQKNRPNLVRSVVWYLDHFERDLAKTVILANGKPAVELTFHFEVHETFSLAGHLDRVVDWEVGGGTFIMDRKTTKSTVSDFYFKRYEMDNQMSLYTFAGQVIYKQPVKGVIIDAAQIAVGFTRFDRGITYRTDDQLTSWIEQTQFWINLSQTMGMNADDRTEHREEEFPQNDNSCLRFGECAFLKVCRLPRHARPRVLETEFMRQPYDPLMVRE